MGRYAYYAPIVLLSLVCLMGCEGLQVNIPVEIQSGPSVKREEAALWVLVENKSTYQIKVTSPVSIGMLRPEQHAVFRLSKPGNYKIVITAFAEDPDYPNVYKPVATVEIPVFLNGYDVVRAKDKFVGYYLEVTEGMLFPDK